MSKEDIFSAFFSTYQTLTPLRIVLIMTVCLLGAAVIYLTYRYTCDETAYDAAFNRGNVMASLITCVIMMMISSNIVISLGMVGALSIVRFRTAVKEARDTLYLFWAIVLGLCVGSQNFTLAGLTTFFIAAVLFAFKLAPRRREKYLLIVRAQAGLPLEEVEAMLLEAAASHRMEALNRQAESLEAVYMLRGEEKRLAALTDKLRGLPGVAQANLMIEQ